MYRTCVDCDGCGAKDLQMHASVGYHVGWDCDPAGGSSTRDIEGWQLCEDCVEWLANTFHPHVPTLQKLNDRRTWPSVLNGGNDPMTLEEARLKRDEINRRIHERRRPARHPDLKAWA